MVVTNRCFTRRAITLAKVNNAELWDRNRLAREILAIRAPTLPAPTDRTLEAEPPEVASVGFWAPPSLPPICQICGAAMVRRRSAYDEFWGCSAFPGCRGMRPA